MTWGRSGLCKYIGFSALGFLFCFLPIYFPSRLPFVKNKWRKLIHSWANSWESRAPGGWPVFPLKIGDQGVEWEHTKCKHFSSEFSLLAYLIHCLKKSWVFIDTNTISISEIVCSIIISGAPYSFCCVGITWSGAQMFSSFNFFPLIKKKVLSYNSLVIVCTHFVCTVQWILTKIYTV